MDRAGIGDLQQTLALLAVVGGEAAYSVFASPSGTPGRADAKLTGAACGALGVSGVLIGTASAPLVYAGLVTGLAGAVGAGAMLAKRTADTESDPDAWPGPKAAPSLVCFACVLLAFTLAESFGAVGAA